MEKLRKFTLFYSACFGILAGFGCQKTTSNNELSESNTISGYNILENELGILAFNIVGPYLIGSLYDNDDVYVVYSLPDLDSLGRFGRIGNGPGEWKGPLFTGQFIQDENGTSVWINDGISNQLLLVNVDKSLLQSRPYLLDSIKLHPKYNLNQYSYILDENTIIGNSGHSSPEAFRLQKVNFNSDKIEKSDLVPKIDGVQQASASHKYSTYFAYLKIKPDKSLLVSAMNSINRIDVFNTELELVSTFEEPSDYPRLTAEYINGPNTSRQFYASVQVTNNYIYALRTKGFFKDSFQKHHQSEILIFDWSLNLVMKIPVSDYLVSLALDEENGNLYGIDFFNEKYFRYDLSEIFKPSNY
ncbi:BF3164 family lipoprotein [Roseivirga echinicomitans]